MKQPVASLHVFLEVNEEQDSGVGAGAGAGVDGKIHPQTSDEGAEVGAGVTGAGVTGGVGGGGFGLLPPLPPLPPLARSRCGLISASSLLEFSLALATCCSIRRPPH